ncbi:hypothetical protein AKJ56_01295 [candidate division MSBL1 archaeon SCGC-AAA382N08]|uniref:PKD domain-containing protein n=1 Tax=candidate division MSBL1 archaeon SCGC-AAA382N08 TaxID=1698285 RepID=A0A133VPS6_9EURY|nr:hypothetical protein AKJ56_01295 [candidate division MSBL1 archaeon SCGC-AAA382N08]
MALKNNFKIIIIFLLVIIFASLSLSPVLSGGGGGGCTDDCSPSGKRVCCNNQNYKRCGDYDSDSCSEWSSCRSCGSDGWRNVGSSYNCCDGNQKCDCQDQEYIDYYCSGGSCESKVANTRTVKSNCTDCSSQGTNCGYGTCQEDEKPSWSCSGGSCNYNCNYKVSCVPDECDSDPDCDDGNPCTIDTCNNPSAGDSTCSYSNKSAGTDCGDCKECDGSGNCNFLCQGNESSCGCVNDSCIDCSEHYGTNCGYNTCQGNEKPSWSCSGSSCNYNCNYDVSCLEEPGVETDAASNVQEDQATLNGNLTSLGGASSCNVWFEWGTDTSYGNETDHTAKSSTGSFPSETISGLSPGMTYHFRAIAENSQGISYGNDEAFSTILGGDATGFGWIGANCTNPAETSCGNSTNPVGWVSFSSEEISCSGSSYEVSVDYDTGEISGAAFIGVGEDSNSGDCNTSENTVGWLYFDSSDTPPFGTSYSYNYPAQIVNSEVRGWAPIISKDENGNQIIVTWVRFKGTNYSTEINDDGTIGTSGGTDHYAWAGASNDGGLGWIDLSPEFSPVVFPPTNRSPEASFLNLPYGNGTYCGVGSGNGQVYFEWEYSDPDGDPQSKFDFEVLEGGTTPVATSTVTDPGSNTQSRFITIGSDKLDYGTYYDWRVKVYDDQGADSGWVYGSDYGQDFTTSDHAWPSPYFTHTPENIAIEETVTFVDQSECYDSTNNEYDCSQGATIDYKWDFSYDSDDGFEVKDTTKGDATTSYSDTGEYTVKLRVYDNTLGSNAYCETQGDTPINATLPLPEWEEVGGQD